VAPCIHASPISADIAASRSSGRRSRALVTALGDHTAWTLAKPPRTWGARPRRGTTTGTARVQAPGRREVRFGALPKRLAGGRVGRAGIPRRHRLSYTPWGYTFTEGSVKLLEE
jgi:hypothetical protein